MEAMLVANLNGLALTTLITNGQNLLLYRILDLPEDPVQYRQELQRGIAVAAAYFEDKLGAWPNWLHCTGNFPADEFSRLLGIPELTVAELAPRPESGAGAPSCNTSIAGVAGALAGAA
jgi:type IV pilus assembly protein PilM